MDESLDGRGRHQSQPTVTDTMRLWVGKWKHCKNDMESAFGEGLWKYWKSLHYFAPLGIVLNLGKKQKRLSSQGALCQDRPCFGGPVRFRGRRFSAFRPLSFFGSFSWQAEQQAHQETISEHGEMMEKHQVQGWRVFFVILFQSTLNLSSFFVLFSLKNSFCRMRWCPISFGWRSSWRWPATSQLLPFFRLPRAQYSSCWRWRQIEGKTLSMEKFQLGAWGAKKLGF